MDDLDDLDDIGEAERLVIERAILFRKARGFERQQAELDLRQAVKRLEAAQLEVQAA